MPPDSQTTDLYSVLMDIRVWVFDHMDAAGNVNVNAFDDYLAILTDEMDGTNDHLLPRTQAQEEAAYGKRHA